MTTSELRPGDVLGGYRIEGFLGAGGMGEVYLAEQLRLGRRVALKVLPARLSGDPGFRARFEREWRMSAQLDHPNAVTVYDAGDVDGVLFISMRYVAGTDLGRVLADGGPLAPGRTLRLLGQVGDALDTAHGIGLIHRDVKPSNILISPSRRSGEETAYLSDFGLTKRTDARTVLTRAGANPGTVPYMAPEQFLGSAAGPASDIYALCCVLFECLTGHIPFDGESDGAIMHGHLSDPPPPIRSFRADLPAGLDRVMASGLSKDPAGRYATAGAMIDAAAAAMGEPSMPPVGLEAPPRPDTPRQVEAAPITVAERATPVRTRAVFSSTTLAFAREGDLWLVDVDQPVQATITRSGSDDDPSWSPDGGRIAFVRRGDLHLMDPEGLSVERLTFDGDNAGPSWSPDGRLVVFERDFDLHVIPADGGEMSRLGVFGSHPAWSATGIVAFDDGADIHVRDFAGLLQRRLTKGTRPSTHPAWFPDGSLLAFARSTEIFVMQSNGKSVIQLTEDEDNGHPTWLPDGRLAFLHEGRSQ